MGVAKKKKPAPAPAKKTVRKLNRKGIMLLADDLVAHQKRYMQETWGKKTDCGTVCCLAGFCYLRKIGLRKFESELRFDLDDGAVRDAGCGQLGLRMINFPQLFCPVDQWPSDLSDEYQSNGPRWRVIAALKALQRLRLNGTIDPNPEKIHTRLPQLAYLLSLRTTKRAQEN